MDTLFLRNRTDWGASTLVTPDSAALVSVVRSPHFGGEFGLEQVEYDLAAGTFHVTANSAPTNSIYCYLTVESYARLRDTFTLVGPEGGASCLLTIHLDLDASTSATSWFCCSPSGGDSLPPGIARASLTESASNFAQATYRGQGPHRTGRLSIQVTRAPGESFDLELWAYAYSRNRWFQWNDQCEDITADIAGTLSIAGLPAGYGVSSCQGYQTGTIVPTSARSWGGIKTLYR